MRKTFSISIRLAWGLLSAMLFPFPGVGGAAEMPAKDLSGRYQGVLSGKKPDGTGPELPMFLILRQEGSRSFCSASIESFKLQIPSEELSLNGDEVRFAMPWAGGLLFELKVTGEEMVGTVRPRPGVPSIPYDTVTLKRVSDLTLSDRIPKLDWEGDERSPRLLELRKNLSEGRTGVVDEFWKTVEKSGAPLVEPNPDADSSVLVTFVWKGTPDTRNVLLLWPRFTYAHPDDYFLSHVEGTDFWFKTLKMRLGTRMYYQFSSNDPLGQRPEGKWPRQEQADPLNPRHDDDNPGRSLLELPGALPQPWYTKRPDVPRYSLVENSLTSRYLKGERKVIVYTPPGFLKRHAPYPSIYLTDGQDPDGLVFATWTFENLLADTKIPPMIVVRIVSPDQQTRNRELSCNDPFLDYVSKEVVPFVRKQYHTSHDPSKTAFGGYSMGGVAAACAGLRHPEIFGLILSQSGAFWYEPTFKDYAEPNWLAREFVRHKRLPLRFYIDAGVDEVDQNGRGGGILIFNRQLRDVLQAKGYKVHYQEFIGDHDHINWRGTLADGLIALFGDGSHVH